MHPHDEQEPVYPLDYMTFSRVLTDEERQRVEKYYADKYQLRPWYRRVLDWLRR